MIALMSRTPPSSRTFRLVFIRKLLNIVELHLLCIDLFVTVHFWEPIAGVGVDLVETEVMFEGVLHPKCKLAHNLRYCKLSIIGLVINRVHLHLD